MLLLLIRATHLDLSTTRRLRPSAIPSSQDRASRMTMTSSSLDPATWPDNALTLANLGHATLLMNFMGVRAISDPSLFNHVGLAVDSLFTIGPRRMIAPPLSPARLQALEVILITHAHMDH